jgi:hypothetical protein
LATVRRNTVAGKGRISEALGAYASSAPSSCRDCCRSYHLTRLAFSPLQLKSGAAEIFGSELAPAKPYEFTGVKLAVFTWKGCVVEVKGKPLVIYKAEETPLQAYVLAHAAIERERERAAAEGVPGPRVSFSAEISGGEA